MAVKRRKRKAERKEDVVRLRVTADQREALVAAAAREGSSISDWLRRLSLREAGWRPSSES